jgi:hypothetical protein
VHTDICAFMIDVLKCRKPATICKVLPARPDAYVFVNTLKVRAPPRSMILREPGHPLMCALSECTLPM